MVFSVARISEEESGAKSYCSKSSDSNNPRRTPVVVPRCKNIIPLPISRSVPSAKYRLICSGTAFSWDGSLPSQASGIISCRDDGTEPMKSLTASQYSSWALYWSQAITANFCRLIPSFGNSRRGTAAPTSANFSFAVFIVLLRSAESVPRRQYLPARPSRFAKAFLSGRSSYRPMRPGCDSAYARC